MNAEQLRLLIFELLEERFRKEGEERLEEGWRRLMVDAAHSGAELEPAQVFQGQRAFVGMQADLVVVLQPTEAGGALAVHVVPATVGVPG